MMTLMDIEQYYFAQRDFVSSLHEKLRKGEKLVCCLFDVFSMSGLV